MFILARFNNWNFFVKILFSPTIFSSIQSVEENIPPICRLSKTSNQRPVLFSIDVETYVCLNLSTKNIKETAIN